MKYKKLTKLVLIVLFSANLLGETSINVKSRYAVLKDYNSSMVLYSKDKDERLYPASITKLIALYVVFEKLKNQTLFLDSSTRVSSNAFKKGHYSTGASTMFLKKDQEVSVEDLIKGIIIVSGNDASIALAEFVSGSEEKFVAEMNTAAKNLKLTNTHFVNVDGLHNKDHYSSAEDVVSLSHALITNFKEYYDYFSIKDLSYNGVTQQNRNTLLFDEIDGGIKVDGLKTGHTDASKYSLAFSALKEYNDYNKFRVVALVSGANSARERSAEAKRLIKWVYSNYKQMIVYKKDDVILKIPLINGTSNSYILKAPEHISILLPQEVDVSNLKVSIDKYKYLVAPLKKGDLIATLYVNTPDERFNRKYELFLDKDIEVQNIFFKFVLSPYYAIKKLIS